MGDHTRRLFAALPYDVERIWLISHSAKELKDNIASLRKRVQKYRNEALSVWQDIEKIGKCDKWGVPLSVPSREKGAEMLEPEEETGKDTEEADVEEAPVFNAVDNNHVQWSVPLADDRNPDAQPAEKVSPGKDFVEKKVNDAGEKKQTEKRDNSEKNEEETAVKMDTSPADGKTENREKNNAELGDTELSFRSQEKSKDEGIIKVHIEAPGNAQGDVRVSFGSAINTGAPSKYPLPPSEQSCPSDGDRKVEANREPRKSKRKLKKGKAPKRAMEEKASTEESVPPKTDSNHPVTKSSNHLGTKSRAKKQTSSSKTEYKPVPEAPKDRQHLTIGRANYPTKMKSSGKKAEGIQKRRTAPREKSYLGELNDYVSNRKKIGDKKQLDNNFNASVKVNRKSGDTSEVPPRTHHEEPNVHKSKAAAPASVSTQTTKDHTTTASSIDINAPASSSDKLISRDLSKADLIQVPRTDRRDSAEQLQDSEKPLLKHILELDSDEPRIGTSETSIKVGEQVDACSSDETFQRDTVLKKNSLEHMIRVSYDTFDSMKQIIERIDASSSENKKCKENLERILSGMEEIRSDAEITEESQQFLRDSFDESFTPGYEDRRTRKGVLELSINDANSFTESCNSFLSSSLRNSRNPVTIGDVDRSFLDGPVLSSTHHGDVSQLPDPVILENSQLVRRSVFCTSSETDSTITDQSEMDYLVRLRECEEGSNHDILTEGIHENLNQEERREPDVEPTKATSRSVQNKHVLSQNERFKDEDDLQRQAPPERETLGSIHCVSHQVADAKGSFHENNRNLGPKEDKYAEERRSNRGPSRQSHSSDSSSLNHSSEEMPKLLRDPTRREHKSQTSIRLDENRSYREYTGQYARRQLGSRPKDVDNGSNSLSIHSDPGITYGCSPSSKKSVAPTLSEVDSAKGFNTSSNNICQDKRIVIITEAKRTN